MYDAVIIGGGAVGCAVARELSRWKLKICLAEQGEDVCVGTSKANSAIVHAGFDAPTGSMKARFNVEGSRRMEALSRELDFPYRRNGALVMCFEEAGLPRLEELLQRAGPTAWRAWRSSGAAGSMSWSPPCRRRPWPLCTPPPAPSSAPSA